MSHEFFVFKLLIVFHADIFPLSCHFTLVFLNHAPTSCVLAPAGFLRVVPHSEEHASGRLEPGRILRCSYCSASRTLHMLIQRIFTSEMVSSLTHVENNNKQISHTQWRKSHLSYKLKIIKDWEAFSSCPDLFFMSWQKQSNMSHLRLVSTQMKVNGEGFILLEKLF